MSLFNVFFAFEHGDNEIGGTRERKGCGPALAIIQDGRFQVESSEPPMLPVIRKLEPEEAGTIRILHGYPGFGRG
jgi:hypothetical protein